MHLVKNKKPRTDDFIEVWKYGAEDVSGHCLWKFHLNYFDDILMDIAHTSRAMRGAVGESRRVFQPLLLIISL